MTPNPPPQGPSPLANARAALHDLRRLVAGHVELALVEAESAGRGLIALVTAGVLAALMLFAAWGALVAAAVMLAIEAGMSWSAALLTCGVVHAVVCGLLVAWMRGRLDGLALPATRRQLRATLGVGR
jgi:hypothetical protein